MSEQEHHITPEDIGQLDEQAVDVLSLKKVDMSIEDYARYSDLDPEDPGVAELLDQYGIIPGESIIVSATDAEDSKNNFLRVVVAGGEDSFTTNRLLTNQLEADLQDGNHPDRSPKTEQVENDTETATGLTMPLIEDLAARLSNDARLSGEGAGGINTANEATALIEAFKGGKVSDEDLSVIAGVLLGASNKRHDIESVLSGVKSSGVLSEADSSAISTQLSSLESMGKVTGIRGDQMKVAYINSLIGKSESILAANNRQPTPQYRVIVGIVTGLSSQIKNTAVSQNLMSGALSRMRKMDGVR